MGLISVTTYEKTSPARTEVGAVIVAVSASNGSSGYTGCGGGALNSDTVTPHCAKTPKGIWLSEGCAPLNTVVNEPPPTSRSRRLATANPRQFQVRLPPILLKKSVTAVMLPAKSVCGRSSAITSAASDPLNRIRAADTDADCVRV